MTTPLHTTEQVAALLGITPRSVRRLADHYSLGTLVTPRLRLYTTEDVATMRQHSTGKPGRPPRLSASLTAAADAALTDAEAAVADGDPDAAERFQRLAGHLDRLATHHAAERILTGDASDDPEQIA